MFSISEQSEWRVIRGDDAFHCCVDLIERYRSIEQCTKFDYVGCDGVRDFVNCIRAVLYLMVMLWKFFCGGEKFGLVSMVNEINLRESSSNNIRLNLNHVGLLQMKVFAMLFTHQSNYSISG